MIDNGHTDDSGIANEFASHFSEVYYQSADDAFGREAFLSDRNERILSRATLTLQC